MSVLPSCDREAQFLKAHNARTEALRNQDRQSKSRNLNEFWKTLHKDLSSWKERLDSLQENVAVVSAAQRNEARLALDALSEELKRLRKKCLADLEIIDLPVTDVRLLHEEFMKHSALLEAAREKLLPRSKFVFKRYRAAMMLKEKQQQQKPNDSKTSTIEPAEQPSADDVFVQFGGTVIRDHSGANIEVEANGVVRIKSQNNQTIACSEIEEGSRLLETSSASILLQNLTGCNIVLNGTFQAVHIQNVDNGSVRVTSPIGGACHITSCQHLHLTLESHQLRIHESADLNCFVRVRSSPILEDCTRVAFYYDPHEKENAVTETKDFNWLRNGIPSPNFTLTPSESHYVPTEKSVAVSDSAEHNIDIPVADATKTEDANRTTASHSTLDDDDDDEL